jgi:hypothetical protein
MASEARGPFFMTFKNTDEFEIELARLWMLAEKAIKAIEVLRDGVEEASILELRYAGRREMQARLLRQSCSGREMTAEEEKKWQRHATEACENCIKARDDAIDSAVMYLNRRVEDAVDKIGLPNVLLAFPELSEFRRRIRLINDLIVQSRGDRTKLNEIYTGIEEAHLPEVLEIFKRFKANEAIGAALEKAADEYAEQRYEAGRRDKVKLVAIFYGLLLSILGNVLSVPIVWLLKRLCDHFCHFCGP